MDRDSESVTATRTRDFVCQAPGLARVSELDSELEITASLSDDGTWYPKIVRPGESVAIRRLSRT
jgi:hypothetical protein